MRAVGHAPGHGLSRIESGMMESGAEKQNSWGSSTVANFTLRKRPAGEVGTRVAPKSPVIPLPGIKPEVPEHRANALTPGMH